MSRLQRHCFGLASLWMALTAAAAPVGNGNSLALDYVSARAGERRAIAENAVGSLFFFRYLQVADRSGASSNTPAAVRMRTREPGSEMAVVFTVRKKVSLRKIEEQEIGVGAALAVTGRVKSISGEPPEILLDPVVVRYRDRHAPKVGKELLGEVDPDARRGTDTTTGGEKVIRETPVWKK